MKTYLSKEIQWSLNQARAQHKRKRVRYRVQFDGSIYPAKFFGIQVFPLGTEVAPHMRGLVYLFEGSNHFSRCLIIAAAEQDGEVKFEFKRSTPPADKAALDFARRPSAPVALLN